MKSLISSLMVSATTLSVFSSTLVSAQTSIRINPGIVAQPEIGRRIPVCLSCPNLSKLPKFRDEVSLQERFETVAKMDAAMQNLKDVPDVSSDVLTSVDFWERLKPAEKVAILGHDFGTNYNWAAAGVVVAAAALAWDVYKHYNKGTPDDYGFDVIRTADSLDYISGANARLNSIQSLQSRLNAFQNISTVGAGLNF